MGQNTGFEIEEVVLQGGVSLLAGTGSPLLNPVDRPIGSLYVDHSSGAHWRKTGTMPNEWSEQVGAGSTSSALGKKSIGMWLFPGNSSAAPGTFGMSAGTVTGTRTARSVATSGLFASARRLGFVSQSASGRSAGIHHATPQHFRGAVAGVGGFLARFRFGISDAAPVANARMFVGLTASAAAIGNVNPSTLTNIIGIGADSGDTQLCLLHNDAAGAATKTPLGVAFPANVSRINLYELEMTGNDSGFGWVLRNLTTGASASGSATTDIPLGTTLLAPQFWRNNGASTGAVGIDVAGFYIESEV